MDTKEKILYEALTLFSEKGYEAVSMEEIAEAVGIKAPSIYKHYKSKRDIFNSIFLDMKRRYDDRSEYAEIRFFGEPDVENFSVSKHIKKVQELMHYALNDEYVSKFMRLIDMESYRGGEFASLDSSKFIIGIMDYHKKLFKGLIKKGRLKKENAEIMALEFVSPIIMLLMLCSRRPETEENAMKNAEKHIRQFWRLYRA